ncbi:acetyl esterase/lipase [Flavobacteriaceae bacterium MAR_2009_75]|nr:acetyl esterase/lipase [Flavobacteriaceae bacterium MAR_2009_75]
MPKGYLPLFLALVFVTANGQNDWSSSVPGKEPKVLTYKVVDHDTLKLQVYFPDELRKRKNYPTMVFFFGGGWNGGDVDQFREQAGYFTSRGMVTVLVDYRVKSRQGTTPYEAVKDAKSSIRFLKIKANELHIDTKKLVVSGGSAGGHLAAAVALLPGINESTDDLAISTKVAAMVLYNPVVDNGPGPGGFQNERMGDQWRNISPIHHIARGAPPTLFLLGDKDHLIPVSVANEFKKKMENVNSRCDVIIYKNEGHGFFNRKKNNDEYYIKTTRAADKFLISLGYLTGKPTI